MKRKGVTLFELLAAIVVFAAVWMGLTRLFQTALREMPRERRVVQVNTVIDRVLSRMARDADAATSLPATAGGVAAGSDRILLADADGVICYELDEGKIVRRRLAPAGPEETTWSVPGARIQWRPWSRDGRAYALEVRTSVRHEMRGGARDKLANSHLYFLGAAPSSRESK